MKRIATLALLLAVLTTVQAQRRITLLGAWNGDRQISLYGGVVPSQGSYMFEFDHLDGDFLAEGGEVTPLAFSEEMSYAVGARLQMISLDRRTLRWGLYLSADGYRSAYSATFAGTDLQMVDIVAPQFYSPANNYRFNSSRFNLGLKFGAEAVLCPLDRLDITAGAGFYVDMQFTATVTTETLALVSGDVLDESTDKYGTMPAPHFGPYINATLSYHFTDHLFAGVSGVLAIDAVGQGGQSDLGNLLTARYASYAPKGLYLHAGFSL